MVCLGGSRVPPLVTPTLRQTRTRLWNGRRELCMTTCLILRRMYSCVTARSGGTGRQPRRGNRPEEARWPSSSVTSTSAAVRRSSGCRSCLHLGDAICSWNAASWNPLQVFGAGSESGATLTGLVCVRAAGCGLACVFVSLQCWVSFGIVAP